MCIRGLIFDFDGTLVDSMEFWDSIGEKYLFNKGIQEHPKNLREILKPISILETAEYFIRDFGIPLPPQTIVDEIHSIIEDQYKHYFPLKEGVLEFIEKYSHLKMCIATATDQHLVEYALKRLQIEKYFEFIITSTEVGNSKQNPDIFIRAAEKLELQIHETVVFEDALHAIRSAKSAGFYVVGISDESFKDERKKIMETADVFIENLNEFKIK